MAIAAVGATDLGRRRELRRMKGLAAGLLVLAAVTYLLAGRAAHSGAETAAWVPYVIAAAEGSLVGGLADWFAVTALFRRPLGLPIPHTAIIPARKDAIGQGLGEFVGTHFLAEDVVRDRIARARPAERAGGWLAAPGNAERIAAELAAALGAGLGLLRDEDVQAVLDQVVTSRLAAMPAGPLLGRLLGEVVSDGAHHGLVDLTLSNAYVWLVENRTAVIEAVARQAPVWTPRFVDERIAERVHVEVLRVVGEVRDDRSHELRASLDRFLVEYARDLREDEATARRVDEVKAALLGHPEVRRAVGQAGAVVRRLVMEAAEEPEGELRRRVTAGVARFGQRLVTDRPLQAKLDGWAGDVAAHVTTNYTGELTRLITDTVERWDGRETARRIELQVGRDLQFIRINGTVVGALAGLAIEALAHLPW